MTVLIRTDASAAIGTGHAMRCLALAGRLAGLGETPVFAARAMFPNLAARIAGAGYALEMLPREAGRNDRRMPHAQWLTAPWRADAEATLALAERLDARWIVLDHYGIDAPWQTSLRAAGRRVAVLDDLADRPHDADLLADPSLSAEPYARYRDLLPPYCQRLLGPRYAILRPEFAAPPERRLIDAIPRWLVAFGGVDAAGMTQMALDALHDQATVEVVVGGQNAALPAIRSTAEARGWTVHVDTDAMGAAMARADLAIGAGGLMLWERAAMALPSVAVVVADNQRDQVRQAARLGLVTGLDAAGLTADALRDAALTLARDRLARAAMAAACRDAVDGGGADRIARRIAAPPISIRRASDADCAPMLAWRNHPRIRATARDDREIAPAAHARWFAEVSEDPDRTLLIGEDAAGPVGVVRFDRTADDIEVSIYLTPERLGGGAGAALLLAAEACIATDDAPPKRVVAEVIPGNAPSAALFRAAGYAWDGAQFGKALEAGS